MDIALRMFHKKCLYAPYKQVLSNNLKKLNYDVIKYDAGDVRNKTIVDQITKHNNIGTLYY